MTDEVALNFRVGYSESIPFFVFVSNTEDFMREYIRTISKTNELVLSGEINNQEIDRLSKSDYRWAVNKRKNFQTRNIKKGDVYQFEFGKNFIPEMSYEHRGLVIGVNKKLLYVLPIFSFDPNKHTDVYHPVDNNNSKSDLFLLKHADYSFIQHDSVMKLNDIRTVSINRILYHQKDGRIDINSKEYEIIEELVLNKYFPGFLFDFRQLKKEREELEDRCREQEQKILELESNIEQMEQVILQEEAGAKS